MSNYFIAKTIYYNTAAGQGVIVSDEVRRQFYKVRQVHQKKMIKYRHFTTRRISAGKYRIKRII